jgi:FkbM family methyltransferase
LGWKGICIEPGLHPYSGLIKNRNCTCVRYFVTNVNQEVNFEEFYYGNGQIKGIQIVEGIRLDKLLPKLNCPAEIDYVSLDVEGVEDKVLEGFPFDKYQSKLWTIEHNLTTGGEGLKNRIKKIMEANGYIIEVENLKHEGTIFEDWWILKSFKDGLDTRTTVC